MSIRSGRHGCRWWQPRRTRCDGGRVIRALYSALMWLAQPLLRRKLNRRGRVEPGYLVAMGDRFGRYTGPAPQFAGAYIWIHAVSLGETRAAAVLIARLRERWPDMRLLLTHGTATGRADGATLLREGDVQVWQPWDTPGNVRRFLQQFRPRIGILMETEVRPNMAAMCQQYGLPLVLANARMSEKSLRQSQHLAWLSKPAYRSLAAVWAQTDEDARRLRTLDSPVRGVLGNIKFDATPDASLLERGRAWRQSMARPVVMFASSREGEEDLLLEYLDKNRAQARVERPGFAINNIAHEVQWLIVPRHPQRFDDVAALIARHGFAISRRSGWRDAVPVAEATQPAIWLGDTLGEMSLYYGMADVVLLGGSFEPLGGQNLIEAAACGCPVIMGPHTFNFAQASELAQAAGAARRVADIGQAVDAARALVNDAAALAAQRGSTASFATAHRGAVDRTVAAISELLGQQ